MRILRLIIVFALFGMGPAVSAWAGGVSFRNDVMAVFSKAGCNAGACHGNKNGKASFKLSLRGQDPDLDLAALTRDMEGRRTNVIDPDRSLILLKPTTQIPHEGGLRFRVGSLEYGILRKWIAAGAPADGAEVPRLVRLEVSPAQRVVVVGEEVGKKTGEKTSAEANPAEDVAIKAIAVFSDGSRRDVSDLAVYEQSTDLAEISPGGLVRGLRMGETTVIVRYLQCQEPVRLAFVPARPGFVWKPAPVNNYIDEAVMAKLKTMRMNPSGNCPDSEFIRRAYLDLLGILPTVEEAKAFVADTSSQKRAVLIDRLLERPEYADQWALKWSDLLRNEERTLDRKGVQNFYHWIRQSFAENRPLNEFVSELLSARGSTYTHPAANYYRANRDAVTRGEATAELFLGVRLKCAQCHNHPFDRWTQDDYYGWADVMGRVDYKILENRRTDTNDSHEFVGEQVVYETDQGEVKDPRGDRTVKPKLLGAEVVKGEDRLDALAAWVTSPENPFFAKAQVNRIWFHLMGRGLVDPVDDFRPTNPASHPELLDRLAKDFVTHHYDVKFLIRLIMNSQAYQMSGEPNETNSEDEVNYSHVLPRRLTAEQLLDGEHEVTGVPAEFAGYPKGMRAGQIPGVRATRPRERRTTQADMFLVTFGKPARQLVCECERSSETTLGQTFQLISGPEIARMLVDPENRLTKLMKAGKSDGAIVDELYWAALCRSPSEEESKAMVEHEKGAKDRRKALEDVAWALLNAKEFVLRR
jgi:hypothetical protein